MPRNKNRIGAVFRLESSDQTHKVHPTTPEDEAEHVVKLRKNRTTHDEVDAPHGTRSMAISKHFRNSMAALKDIILLKPEKPDLYTTNNRDDNFEGDPGEYDPMASSETLLSEDDDCCLSNGSFFALRILFVDLLIACCDLASGFLQGYALLSTEGKRVFGFITFGINWIPGIVAAIHLLSVYRRELPWYKAILCAILLIVFYPLVPILALLILLWMKPNNNKSLKELKEFKKAEYGATVSSAIRGCIASPTQLGYQLWLALNGIIVLEWNDAISFSITDWEGNEILISFAAPLCICFSILK